MVPQSARLKVLRQVSDPSGHASGIPRRPDRDYVLFVTSSYKHSAEEEGTGGTISNRLLMETIAEHRNVVVLHLEQGAASAWTFEGSRVRVEKAVWPKWTWSELARKWIPFVQAETRSLVRRRGAPAAVFATTDAVSALGTDLLKGIPSAVIVRAFENFGLWPPKVTWSTRYALAKQAAVRRFSDSGYLHGADLLVTNSAFMARCIGDRFRIERDRIVVVPQLCDVVPIAGQSDVNDDAIGFVNRNSDKNLGFVRKLAERLKERRFVVYGSVPETTDEAPTNMEFRGWEPDRNRMFAQAGLWIMPSAWPEPFGRVSIEAQAANRRVLVADVGGLPETVADPRYLISGYDPAEWARRMEELLALPDRLVAEHGAAIREKFSEVAHERAIGALMNRLVTEATSGELE